MVFEAALWDDAESVSMEGSRAVRMAVPSTVACLTSTKHDLLPTCSQAYITEQGCMVFQEGAHTSKGAQNIRACRPWVAAETPL